MCRALATWRGLCRIFAYRTRHTQCVVRLFLGVAYVRSLLMECFHMTSRRPYWCPKTMKRRPCWCPKLVIWELNSFLMQTLSFVPINLHICWPREWKHRIDKQSNNSARTSHFFVHFFASLRLWRKRLNFTFCGERDARQRLSFSFPELRYSLSIEFSSR